MSFIRVYYIEFPIRIRCFPNEMRDFLGIPVCEGLLMAVPCQLSEECSDPLERIRCKSCLSQKPIPIGSTLRDHHRGIGRAI